MSAVTRGGMKIHLPRQGLDPFWETVLTSYALDDTTRWRNLAMLVLRENAGWSFDQIGTVFGLNKGHVLRCIRHVTRDLRETFQLADDFAIDTPLGDAEDAESDAEPDDRAVPSRLIETDPADSASRSPGCTPRRRCASPGAPAAAFPTSTHPGKAGTTTASRRSRKAAHGNS